MTASPAPQRRTDPSRYVRRLRRSLRSIRTGVADRRERAYLSRQAPDVLAALRLTDENTLISQRKRLWLRSEAQRILESGVEGDFLELGVHRAGGIGMVASLLAGTDRRLHLFDRWGDLPDPTQADGAVGALYDRRAVPELYKKLRESDPRGDAERLLIDDGGMAREQITFHQGWFDETLPAYDGGPIAFAHLDADFYESMVLAFEFTEKHLSDGGTVVIDDLGDWPGVDQALEEYLARSPRKPVLTRRQQGQGVLRYEPSNQAES